jgi:glycosyltransferase involved in cell wall biosynthesis
MRITIVTGPWLPVPALQGGSVPRMWHGLAEEFAARGHEVLVMARSFRAQSVSEIQNGVRYERSGGFAQSRFVWLDLIKDFFYAARVLRHLPAADILIINDFWLPFLAGQFRRKIGRLVVSANRFPKHQYGLYHSVDRVIAASRAIENAILQQTPGMMGKVRCIPNPLDTKMFVPPASGRQGRTRKQILYTGRIHPEKGVHVLVAGFAAIAKKYPEVSLRIVGPSDTNQGGGGGGYLGQLRRLAGASPVTFSPPEFDVSELALIYQEADLFCYPSLAEKGEALPVAPLEAMSAGLPIMVSALECFDDFVRDGENALRFNHRSGDPASAFSTKLDVALRNWNETLKLGTLARNSAQRYAISQVANEFLADFERLLSRKQN